jgi:putative membrane protein
MNPGPPGTAQPHVMPGVSIDVPTRGSTMTASPAAAAFLKKVAQDNLAETDLAQLVQTKTANADVKSYAQMLATDHQKANDEVMAIAKSKNVTLPTTPPAAAKATKARLEKLSGAAFDHAYAAAMVADHQKAITAFTAATKNADADVKAFAEKTLPTLKHHLEEAQKLSKQRP